MIARNMRPIILAMCVTILSHHVPMLYGFTVPPQHQHSLQPQLPVGRRSSQNDYSQIQVCSNINSNINSRTNGIRIRHEFRAVNVEQENDTRQQTTSINFGSNNNNDFDNNNSNIYEILGIEEGQLALGVKPEEVYKYIGTREELISKTLTDIPTLSREMAEKEVDKFLMDSEMVNMYIQFGKEVEKDPNFFVPDNDNDADSNNWFSPKNIVAGYLAYVGVTSGPQIIRRYIAEQEVKGEWEPTNIQFIDQWVDTTSADATARVLQKAAEKAAKIAAAAMETTTTSSSVVDTPDAVTDSLQSLVDTVTAVSP